MDKKLFILKDEICSANNKTPADIAKLYEVMTHYGVVKPFEQAVSEIRAEYQLTIDSLNSQINAIKEQELTADEMSIVKAYRIAKAEVVSKHIAVENECRQTIAKLEETLNQFKSKIIAVVGE